jgi:3-phosphoglycerate kinase
MKTVDSINFAGKKALIRVDFNVPLDKKTLEITDDARIKAAIPTIKKILADGGAIILMSHLGRPLKKLNEDGTIDIAKHTLKNVVSRGKRINRRNGKVCCRLYWRRSICASKGLESR